MNWLIIWLSIYVLAVVLSTIVPDKKLNDWKGRLLFATLTLWTWPIMVILAPGLLWIEYKDKIHFFKKETRK